MRSQIIYFLWNPLSGLAEFSRLSGVGAVGAVGVPRCKTCSVSELTYIEKAPVSIRCPIIHTSPHFYSCSSSSGKVSISWAISA